MIWKTCWQSVNFLYTLPTVYISIILALAFIWSSASVLFLLLAVFPQTPEGII